MHYSPLLLLSLLALSGCASLTEEPQPNYAVTNKINKWGIPAYSDPTEQINPHAYAQDDYMDTLPKTDPYLGYNNHYFENAEPQPISKEGQSVPQFRW